MAAETEMLPKVPWLLSTETETMLKVLKSTLSAPKPKRKPKFGRSLIKHNYRTVLSNSLVSLYQSRLKTDKSSQSCVKIGLNHRNCTIAGKRQYCGKVALHKITIFLLMPSTSALSSLVKTALARARSYTFSLGFALAQSCTFPCLCWCALFMYRNTFNLAAHRFMDFAPKLS